MSEIIQNWKFSEDLVDESESVAAARVQAAEMNQSTVSASMGKQIAFLTGLHGIKNTVEIGMGSGLSGLYLLEGSPQVTITSIDPDPMVHDAARAIYQQARVPSNQLRFITGRPEEVLPRLNDGAYDMFLYNAINTDPQEMLEHGTRLTSANGMVLVANVFLGGKLAQPANRDEQTQKVRALLNALAEQDVLKWHLIPVGNGLLQISK